MKRWIELMLLYGVLPALCIFQIVPVHIVLFLVVVCIGCLLVLLNDGTFDRNLLRLFARAHPGGAAAARPGHPVSSLLPAFALAAVALTAAVWFLHRDHLFALPRRAPLFWLAIMTLYPVVSVVPQEIIYRVYFFHRFESLFPSPALATAACAVIFGLHHAVFHNWPAVALSLGGGLKFALTYRRSRSLRLVCIEHALYGCLVFTIGLGHFFASGSYCLAAMLIPENP